MTSTPWLPVGLFLQVLIICPSVLRGAPGRPGDDHEPNFAAVIDAGSSGSRAYLYTWPNPHNSEPLLNINPMLDAHKELLVKSVAPGLSSLKGDPNKVGEYISPLLNFVAENIPEKSHAKTKLFILATAGMRLLNENDQNLLMSHLAKFIADNYKFECSESNLEVISGKDEGIYQWISINYVLGRFNRTEKKSAKDQTSPDTAGALDMGGASLQIAVEVPDGPNLERLSVSDQSHIDVIDLGSPANKYRVFVTTFLGFGANEALERHRRSLILSQLENNDFRGIVGDSPSNPVEDPCLSRGLLENASLSINLTLLKPPDMGSYLRGFDPDLTIYLKGTGDWNECYVHLSKFVRSQEPYLKSCEVGTTGCPDKELSRPPIDFDSSEFFGFSEFWYTAEDVMRLGGVYTYEKFKNAAQQFCQQDWSITEARYHNGDYPLADLNRMKSQCFKSVWIPVSLHQGLSFPETYTRLTAIPNYHNGQVIHWTLGALLYRTRNLTIHTLEAGPERTSRLILFSSKDPSFSYVILLILATLLALMFLNAKRLKRFVSPNTLKHFPLESRLLTARDNG